MKLQIGIDGKTYEVEVEVIEEDTQTRPGGYMAPYVETATTVRSQPVASAPAPAAAEGPVDEAKVCRSPVAGMVIKINVEVGQELEDDELIMVL
ncbi:MAG TPA: acetyl-CoA carboxylase biotin carboxyl carrier protein subunit, partial [Rhodospirillaceae bacterium]|nr:acetyl-CoA carboxylase biotin carboxyl carrier protein subunit [Rhodospirillaceae bacterium]